MHSATAVKPCPFCGSTVIGPEDPERPSTMECYGCGATGPESNEEFAGCAELGISMWNSRGKIDGLAPGGFKEPPNPVHVELKAAALPCPFCGEMDISFFASTPEGAAKLAEIVCAGESPEERRASEEQMVQGATVYCTTCNASVCGSSRQDPAGVWNRRV